ncbi:MRJP4 protein, partial [Acromyrmex insinuator]
MGHSLFALPILSTAIVSFGLEVNVVHKGKHCQYEWESEQQKEDAISSGAYSSYMSIFIDAKRVNNGRVFVTAPREIDPSSPATLATVTDKTGSRSPLLHPYLSCVKIEFLLSLQIQCNHIVILDNGKIEFDQICNPIFIADIQGSGLYYASLSKNKIYKVKIKMLLKCPNKKEANEHVIFYSNVQNYYFNVVKRNINYKVILAQDSKKLQFISGLKYSSYWDQLTYFSDRYQRFVLGTVNLNEIHFRYMEMDLVAYAKKTDLFSKTKTTKSLFSIF